MRSEKAFTGLESAIILIAFVVVASVFAFTILGVGFFTTDKAKVITQESTIEASAVMYPEGGVYGSLYPPAGAFPGQLESVQFTLAIPQTGLDQDLSKNMIIYTQYDDQGHIVNLPKQFTFSGTETPDATHFGVQDGAAEPIMKAGERRMFYMTALEGPVPGGYFTIETKPKNGVGAFIQKYIPSGFDGGLIL